MFANQTIAEAYKSIYEAPMTVQTASKTYKIRQGDNLTKIAKAHNVDVNDLAKHNNLKLTDRIYAGKTLSIPLKQKVSTTKVVKSEPRIVKKTAPKPIAKPTTMYSPSDSLINAIIDVESNGRDNALGDRGLSNKAYGCMQIRKPVLTDVNDMFKTNYTEVDCLDRAKSKEIFHKYMQRYKPKSDEECARMWNGGPGGMAKTSTKNYWDKVKARLA